MSEAKPMKLFRGVCCCCAVKYAFDCGVCVFFRCFLASIRNKSKMLEKTTTTTTTTTITTKNTRAKTKRTEDGFIKYIEQFCIPIYGEQKMQTDSCMK